MNCSIVSPSILSFFSEISHPSRTILNNYDLLMQSYEEKGYVSIIICYENRHKDGQKSQKSHLTMKTPYRFT